MAFVFPMSLTKEWVLDAVADYRARRGDTTLIEIKAAQGDLPENLPETICAFANSPSGGAIILGVDESQDFKITGVSDPAVYESGIASQAQQAVSPPPHLETTTRTIQGNTSLSLKFTACISRRNPQPTGALRTFARPTATM